MTITGKAIDTDSGAVLFTLDNNERYTLEDLRQPDRNQALWLLSTDELRSEAERIGNLSKHLASRSNYEGARPLGLITDEIEVFLVEHPNHK